MTRTHLLAVAQHADESNLAPLLLVAARDVLVQKLAGKPPAVHDHRRAASHAYTTSATVSPPASSDLVAHSPVVALQERVEVATGLGRRGAVGRLGWRRAWVCNNARSVRMCE